MQTRALEVTIGNWQGRGFARYCATLAKFADQVSYTLEEIKAQGLYKTERIITSPQNAQIRSPTAGA